MAQSGEKALRTPRQCCERPHASKQYTRKLSIQSTRASEDRSSKDPSGKDAARMQRGEAYAMRNALIVRSQSVGGLQRALRASHRLRTFEFAEGSPRMAAEYTAAVAPTRPLDVTRFCGKRSEASAARTRRTPQSVKAVTTHPGQRTTVAKQQRASCAPSTVGGYVRRGTAGLHARTARWASSCPCPRPCRRACPWHPFLRDPWRPCPT